MPTAAYAKIDQRSERRTSFILRVDKNNSINKSIESVIPIYFILFFEK
jgi:hypothetical protein